MPLQTLHRRGITWYRWGMEGKLYRNREDALRQGAAVEANKHKPAAGTATKKPGK